MGFVIFLMYVFFTPEGQPMVGMAEFDTLKRCEEEGIPRAKEHYPGSDPKCMTVQKPVNAK